jgi:hypothetical protein
LSGLKYTFFAVPLLGSPISVYNNRNKETISSSYVEDNIRAKRGFWQIPHDQITLSGNVYKQNAGWE